MPDENVRFVFVVLLVSWVSSRTLDECLESNPVAMMNVVLLEDEGSDWSLTFVQGAVIEAIEQDKKKNEAESNFFIKS